MVSSLPQGLDALDRLDDAVGVGKLDRSRPLHPDGDLQHGGGRSEGADEAVVQPQAAEEALEYLAGYLQRLEGPQRRKVLEDLEALAAFARQEGWAKSAVRFLKEFPAEYGFGEEETT